jgi:hypothetical protein
MTIQDLRDKGLILFECLSGSHAYGTNKASSDMDYRGVFILPQDNLYGMDYIGQVSDETNDITFYEIGRFMELLESNNPNILEILNMPDENIIFRHPVFDIILEQKYNFLTTNCKNSFGGYAATQIKKARGLNKKIVNPMEKERKTLLDFCWVPKLQGSIPLKDFFKTIHEQCDVQYDYIPDWLFGCSVVPHMKDTYNLFVDFAGLRNLNYKDEMLIDYMYAHRKYNGVIDKDGVQVKLSSIDKDVAPITTFYCNIEGFSKYCKDYREYWDWEEKKNLDRFQTNIAHGKQYDSKNMMHCIRLLRVAKEIGLQKRINVRRTDVVDLMSIRNGEREYDDLLAEADAIVAELPDIFANSGLPEKLDHGFVNEILVNIRKQFYGFKTPKKRKLTYRKPKDSQETIELIELAGVKTIWALAGENPTSSQACFKAYEPILLIYDNNKLVGGAHHKNKDVQVFGLDNKDITKTFNEEQIADIDINIKQIELF